MPQNKPKYVFMWRQIRMYYNLQKTPKKYFFFISHDVRPISRLFLSRGIKWRSNSCRRLSDYVTTAFLLVLTASFPPQPNGFIGLKLTLHPQFITITTILFPIYRNWRNLSLNVIRGFAQSPNRHSWLASGLSALSESFGFFSFGILSESTL